MKEEKSIDKRSACKQANQVIKKVMAPAFKQERFAEGVRSGVDAIIAELSGASSAALAQNDKQAVEQQTPGYDPNYWLLGLAWLCFGRPYFMDVPEVVVDLRFLGK